MCHACALVHLITIYHYSRWCILLGHWRRCGRTQLEPHKNGSSGSRLPLPADRPLWGHGDDQHPGAQKVGGEKRRREGGRSGRGLGMNVNIAMIYIQVRKEWEENGRCVSTGETVGTVGTQACVSFNIHSDLQKPKVQNTRVTLLRMQLTAAWNHLIVHLLVRSSFRAIF